MARPRTKIRWSRRIAALPSICTTDDASEALGLKRDTIAKHARENRFAGCRLFAGRDWAIPKASLLAFYGVPVPE